MASAVVPLQLLVRQDKTGHRHLDVVENRDRLRASAFETTESDAEIPQIGTRALLRAAKLLMDRRYVVVRVELNDPRLGPVPDEDGSQISFAVVQLLEESGVNAALRLLASEGPCYVTGVEVQAPDGTRAVLRKHGVLIARPGSVTLKVLPEIWPELERFQGR